MLQNNAEDEYISMFLQKIEAPKGLQNFDILATDCKPVIAYVLIYQSWGISITVPDENQSQTGLQNMPLNKPVWYSFFNKSVSINTALAHDSVSEC